MINAELARAFDRIADLLEIDGADTFRINSYRRASRTIKNTTEDIASIAAEGRLTELPGIGKGSAARVQQYIDTGRIDVLDELERRLPRGLPDLLAIPGLGPKKIALAHGKLGVQSLPDLKRVIKSGELAKLPRLGAASVKKIAEGIAFLESSGDRTPLGVALPIAEAFAERVRRLKGVKRVEIAGSLRRGVETIGDIDLLCEAADGSTIVKQFVTFDGVKRVLAAGATKGSVTVETSLSNTLERAREIQVDLRVVTTESFGAAWQYFTGSKEHNVRLRELAVKKRWRLNEYGLYDAQRPHAALNRLAGRSEEGLYRKLGLRLVPAELREDRGEFEEEAAFDKLVTLEDIRGDLHVHTTASDGKNTIEEMARAAQALGYEYIAICDHSKSASIANGLSIERMQRHITDIRRADKQVKGDARVPEFAVLAGCECDILPDGSLDYPDDLLARCDWVVASIHSAMGTGDSANRARSGRRARPGKLSATERTLSAMENPYVSAIGHPTGRLINRRAPMALDMALVIEAAAQTNTLLEINASWQRLDLKDVHVLQVRSVTASRSATAGRSAIARFVINTDAHHTEQLAQMRYGVMTARRGGALKTDVVNTLSLPALRKRITAKRG